MSAVSTRAASPRQPWLAGFMAGEYRAWVFVAKSLLALYLTSWLAMWLQLEQPSTAMITVAVVMHPHSGMVLAKSFYRAIGTVAGSLCGLTLMALFPQQRELFLLSLSLWLGLCAGGAMLYRNFMSYGFVLAGYTAAIVALPAVDNPLLAFDSAVMRVSEVLLGLVVAGVISDVVLPERLRLILRRSARQQFAHFIDFVRGSVGGSIARPDMEQAHLQFVQAAVQLEDMRASVIFEDAEMRARSGRMRLLNQHYMAASTSFQSAHHMINRLQRGGRRAVADALIALYQPIGVALSPEPSQRHEPMVLAPRLAVCVTEMQALAIRLRDTLAGPADLLEFDTGALLLQRFAQELHDFTSVEASLRRIRQPRSMETVHFRRGNDLAGAGVAVLRTFLTMATLSLLWVLSGWALAVNAMLMATIFSGILAASPSPVKAAVNTLIGFLLGMLAVLVCEFGWLTEADGFVMLILGTAPLLLIGPYLSTRATLPGIGAAYTLGFVYILALKNPMVFDPEHFLNDMIVTLIGIALTGVAFVFVPAVTGSGWQRRRQMRRLRQQVVQAANAPLSGLLHRFESINHDLFQQIVTYTVPNSAESRSLLAWALTVNESGRALIALRQELTGGELDADVEDAVHAVLHGMARLYQRPDTRHWLRAEHAVQQAIALCGPLTSRSAQQRVRLHLHQLRSALHDDESPMVAHMPVTDAAVASSQEIPDAS